MRYSEDLDYVSTTTSRIGFVFDRIRQIAKKVGLEEGRRKQSEHIASMRLRFSAGAGGSPMLLKVEVNTAELGSVLGCTTVRMEVDSPRWWSGYAEVRTFRLEELAATKVRALHQRKKGRDLFDLWLVLTGDSVDGSVLARCARHYLPPQAASARDIALALDVKLADPTFRGDIDGLVIAPPEEYDVDAAGAIVREWILRSL